MTQTKNAPFTSMALVSLAGCKGNNATSRSNDGSYTTQSIGSEIDAPHMRMMLRAGEKDYRRRRDLPGLLHLFPAEIEKLDKLNTSGIAKKLTRALRAERQRGRSGHWRYSLTRHIGLMQALRAEQLRLSGHVG